MPSSKIQQTSLDPRVLSDVAQEETLQEMKSSINTINTNTNTTATDTANIKSTVSTINTNASTAATKATAAASDAATIKTNTATNNTASATGTLSQKLSYIINKDFGDSVKNFTFSVITISKDPAAPTTITGSGYLFITDSSSNTAGGSDRSKFVLDGITVQESSNVYRIHTMVEEFIPFSKSASMYTYATQKCFIWLKS